MSLRCVSCLEQVKVTRNSTALDAQVFYLHAPTASVVLVSLFHRPFFVDAITSVSMLDPSVRSCFDVSPSVCMEAYDAHD